jgi:hypothetical protein
MSSRTIAAESSADFQSAVSQDFILQAAQPNRSTQVSSNAVQIEKRQAPEKAENRNSKTENNLTADYADFTDIFADARS